MKIDKIADIVCGYYRVDKDKLFKKGKRGNVVKAKQLISYYGHHMLEMSLLQVAEYFGLREHSTVLHRCKTILNCIACKDYIYDDYVATYKDVYNIAIGDRTLVMVSIHQEENVHNIIKKLMKFNVEIEIVKPIPEPKETLPEIPVANVVRMETLSPADEVRRKYL